jgi:hypothetical protein
LRREKEKYEWELNCTNDKSREMKEVHWILDRRMQSGAIVLDILLETNRNLLCGMGTSGENRDETGKSIV